MKDRRIRPYRTLSVIFTMSLLVSVSYARHVPVREPDYPIVDVPSLPEETPKPYREVFGTTDKTKFAFDNLKNIVGDAIWDNQDELSQSIYDSLSDFSVSTELINKDLFDNDETYFRADWDATAKRKVFLNGPATATEDKSFQYLEVNSLSTRVRTTLGHRLSGDVGANFSTGVGVAFHYAKVSELHKTRELRKMFPVESHFTVDPIITEAMQPVVSTHEQNHFLSEIAKATIKETRSWLVKNIDKIITTFENKVEHISERFVDDDKGKAYMARLFDPARLPYYMATLNRKLLPISFEKIKLMKKNEMMFFTAYFDLGYGLSASKGILRAGLNRPVRLAYHASVRKLEGGRAMLKVQISLDRSWEVPRVHAGVDWFVFDYRFFNFAKSYSNRRALDYIFQYDLSSSIAQNAFNALLKLNPAPSVDAANSGQGSVSTVIGKRTTRSSAKRTPLYFSLPAIIKVRRNHESGISDVITREADQKTLLSRTLDARNGYSRELSYNLKFAEEDERRNLQVVVSTNLDENGNVIDDGKVQGALKPSRPFTNVNVKLVYDNNDKFTSRREFEGMVSFFDLLLGSQNEVISNPNVQQYLRRDPRALHKSRQAFAVELTFSREALTRILSRDEQVIWSEFAKRIFGYDVWRSRRARQAWLGTISANGDEGEKLCDGVGLVSGIYHFPECRMLYLRTRRIANGFKDIRSSTDHEAMFRRFNDLTDDIGEYPALAYAMIKLNGGLDGIHYKIRMAGKGYTGAEEIANDPTSNYFDQHYGEPIPRVSDLRNTASTIRYAEVFKKKGTNSVILALETSRFIEPGDTLFIELYKYKLIRSDKFLARYQVKGPLRPIRLNTKDKNPADMNVRRYRYEIGLPESFLDQFRQPDGSYSNKRHNFQFMFIKHDLSDALSEVGEVSFRVRK